MTLRRSLNTVAPTVHATRVWTWALAAVLGLASGSLPAQDPPAPPVSTPDESAAEPPGEATRLLLVPFQDLKGTINDLGSSVMVPLRDYLEWQKRLKDKPVEAPAVITSARYQATVEKDLARIRAELKVRVPGKPWAELPLSFGDAAIASLDEGDGSILLRADANGATRLLVGKSGEHTVVLQLVARVRTLPMGSSWL